MKLGVNVDHVATLREARRGLEPSPVLAALLCEAGGADSIVAHLREDRRHIKDQDIHLLRKVVRTKFNLEMSCADEIVEIACTIKPDQATLVPERRQELTTEGGLDVEGESSKVKKVIEKLQRAAIEVSLFIGPDKKQIDAASKLGASMIEIHTGKYADAKNRIHSRRYFGEIKEASLYAKKKGFKVFAGHGLDYHNVRIISGIKEIEELNIGHSIISHAVLVGLTQAVREMKALIS